MTHLPKGIVEVEDRSTGALFVKIYSSKYPEKLVALGEKVARNYPPQGYDTKWEIRRKDSNKNWYLKLSRYKSCD